MTKEEELRKFEQQLNGSIEPPKQQVDTSQRQWVPGMLREGTTRVKKNILLAYNSCYSGCGNLRCIFPIEYLNNIYAKSGKFIGLISPTFIYQEDILARTKNIHFQRQMTPNHLQVIRYYKSLQPRFKYTMTYEIDDNLWKHNEEQGGSEQHGVPSYNFGAEGITDDIKKASVEIMNLMDKCIFSTQWLADFAKNELEIKPPCYVLPNAVGAFQWGTEKKEPIKEYIKKPRVIYTGSSTHYSNKKRMLGDFNNAWYNWLLKSIRNDEIDFICMAGIPWFLESVKDKITTVNWVPTISYHKKVQSLNADFGIMPLVPNDFNRGKSDIKAIEHYIDGVPCIGTTFSDGTMSPYDNNPLSLPDNCTVQDIDELFEKVRHPKMYNDIREQQYKLLENGRLYESKEYIQKFMDLMF